LTDPILECFVLLINSSELLLTVIFNDIVNVNLSCLKECSSDIWISMVAHLNLFTLNFYLLKKWQFYFFFFCLNWNILTFFLLNSEFSIFLTSHLLNKFPFVLLISLFLNLIKFNFPLHGLLFSNSFSFLHFFCVSDSVFLSLFSLFLLSLFSDLTSFFSQFLKFSSSFLRWEFRLLISLTLESHFLFKIRFIFVLLNPFLRRLDTCVSCQK